MQLKRLLFLLIVLSIYITAHAQNKQAYTDSILSFQQRHTVGMYPLIKQDTALLRFYSINPAMHVQATVRFLDNQPKFKMTTSSGRGTEAYKYAEVSFSLKGKPYTLFAYQLTYLQKNRATQNEFFIPFLDATSNESSYAGGRYMDFNENEIKQNKLWIDFNKAYNPYCAFVNGYNCPIPPKENTLPIPILAGEAYEKEKFKH